MKIYSGFKDYYDSTGAYDHEARPVYARKTEEFLHTVDKGLRKDWESWKVRGLALASLLRVQSEMPRFGGNTRHVIAFCGKAFPFYWVGKRACYTPEALADAVKDDEEYTHRSFLGKSFRFDKGSSFIKGWERLQKLMSPFGGQQLCQLPDDAFVHFKSPVILIGDVTYKGKEDGALEYNRHGRWITVNPRLNKYNFASQVDPYTAYQELDMFLGNNLVFQEDANAHVTDALMVHYKGFDKTYGFRTRPGSKK